MSNYSPQDVVLKYDGDKVISYCWTKTIGESETATGKKSGRVFMLGVDPDYRGQGIGKGVLLVGLLHLKNKGLQVVKLTVDSRNKAACALYQSIGFRAKTSSLWYEKPVD